VKKCVQLCTKNVLAQVWVLAPEVPLSKIVEEAESQEYLDAVEKVEPEVDDLAGRIAENLSINISSPYDNA
jgi:hypothetical protein